MIKLGLFALFVTSAAWANSTGAVAGVAGVPPDGDNCTQCHGGTANTGSGKLTVDLVNASTWTPGQQVRVRITLVDPTARRWGFEITARSATNPNTNAGTFAVVDDTTTQIRVGGPGSQYVTHRAAGTSPGTADSSTWDVFWTPPADAGFGAVTFYAAGNAANNNNTNDSGDKIYTTSLDVSPAAGETPGTSYALSQLAFGGGWYTAVYLTNANSAAATATLNYFGADGKPLDIANVGTSTTLNLAPKATGLVEAADLGPLTQGWIELKLPDGVTGYGVFRQTVGGRPQEAVVPLANTVSTAGTFIFDDTNYTTAAAFTNVGSGDANLTVTARDSAGATIGTNTLPVSAKARSAVVLQSLGGLETMRGKRGTIEFSSSTPITILGLRFNGEAFTSIPAVQSSANPSGESPAGTYALSQLAFGGGWYTAIYLTNANSSAATATLNYFGADGAPLNITNVGTSTTLNLGPKATGIVEAADLGPLTQGWVEVKLPDGVSGYGVFRQTVGGRPQEAVVPLANTVSSTGTFIFDETNYTTAAALTNVGTGDTTVTVTARDSEGVTIGTNTFPLTTKVRSAVVLQSLAGLETMKGKRGTIEFSASAPITILGLRFNGEAFTSIPAVQK